MQSSIDFTRFGSIDEMIVGVAAHLESQGAQTARLRDFLESLRAIPS